MKAHTNNTSPSATCPEHAIPTFGICGYSGSGKTTLIAELVQNFCREGLRLAVIKQDAHGLDIDREGKDTDLLFRAGADVHICDQGQSFFRSHDTPSLHETIHRLAPLYDLLLVEGHKSADLPYKVWLCKTNETAPPPEATNISLTLPWNANRAATLLALIRERLQAYLEETPIFAGILIGGKSSRMGTPKHLLPACERTWLEQTIATFAPHVAQCVILGNGDLPPSAQHLPRLPDLPDQAGPLAGLRAAMRWGTTTQWVFCACDLPNITPEAVAWLLAQRRPGVRAILPTLTGKLHPEPLLAWYGPPMAAALEQVSRPRDLADYPGVITPEIPAALAPQWLNANTPTDIPQIPSYPSHSE